MCRAVLVHDFQSKESMFGAPCICALSAYYKEVAGYSRRCMTITLC